MNIMPRTTLVNLRRATHVSCWWDNGKGCQCKEKPPTRTANGEALYPDRWAKFHWDYPHESEVERAIRLDIIDHWYFVCRVILSNNRELYYRGEEAQKIWKTWQGVVFNKGSKTK